MPALSTLTPSPVFGCQSSWFCFRLGIVADYHHDRETQKFSLPDPSDHADIAFLFLSLASGSGRRIICPALSFDRAGDFKDVWRHFVQSANSEAAARTGLAYKENDALITTAWRGELSTEKARKR